LFRLAAIKSYPKRYENTVDSLTNIRRSAQHEQMTLLDESSQGTLISGQQKTKNPAAIANRPLLLK
jgi:hypothetical protein